MNNATIYRYSCEHVFLSPGYRPRNRIIAGVEFGGSMFKFGGTARLVSTATPQFSFPAAPQGSGFTPFPLAAAALCPSFWL